VVFSALVLVLPLVVLAWPQPFHSLLLVQLLADGLGLRSRSLASALHRHGRFPSQSVVELSLSVER
jgi:hypothetical protein